MRGFFSPADEISQSKAQTRLANLQLGETAEGRLFSLAYHSIAPALGMETRLKYDYAWNGLVEFQQLFQDDRKQFHTLLLFLDWVIKWVPKSGYGPLLRTLCKFYGFTEFEESPDLMDLLTTPPPPIEEGPYENLRYNG